MDAITAHHLDEAVRPDLLLPDDQRIARIDRDRWIGYGRAREILAELERILRSERRQRPDNLLIIGASDHATWCLPPYVIAKSELPGEGHWERALHAMHGRAHRRQIKVGACNDPRCTGASLARRQQLGLNQPDRGHLADTQIFDDLIQNEFTAFGPFSLAIARDLVLIAERTDARFVQVCPFAVRRPARFRKAAMVPSGKTRASSVMIRSVSTSVCQRCSPDFCLRVSITVWSPPCQCSRNLSFPPMIVTTISRSTVRKMRFRIAAEAAGWFQSADRSRPSVSSCSRCSSIVVSCFWSPASARSASRWPTIARLLFQRRSNSAATSRLSGSTASYCRRASPAS